MDPQWPKYYATSSNQRPFEIDALPGETAAFQIVIASGVDGLEGVSIDTTDFPNFGLRATEPVEIFLVHEIPIQRRSGGQRLHESLGWASSAMPRAPRPPTTIADALIPIAHAPHWAPYPSQIPARSSQAFWVDLRIPESGTFPITKFGTLRVRSQAGMLASIPIKVSVGSTPLPYAAARTILYFDPQEIVKRVGTAEAVDQYLQLIHAHGISSSFPLESRNDVQRFSQYLNGDLFSERHGYVGAGAQRSADVVVIGAYGAMEDPRPDSLARVDEMLLELERLGLTDSPGKCDIFLYAIDEQCDSPRGRLWQEALRSAESERLRRLRVGQTCSESPAGQPVDLVMMFASAYSPTNAWRGRRTDKQVWIYNGMLPNTGSFLTDAPTLSLTANGWLQAAHRIDRWFYWESTFWEDGNRGGLGPYDPFATAETFHNDQGDYCNGDGMLVYPGRQLQFPQHDLGLDGVVPSIRLKQWRRGVQDAAYVELARQRDRKAAERIVNSVVTGGLDAAHGGSRVPWRGQAEAFARARKQMFDLIESKPK
ncbi:MAG TPA: DUF4091 domain-containing protein [Polyangiaceae bacterium]|nr:DUF4091 domain-containing protein [Polyangiaceae bacterium]